MNRRSIFGLLLVPLAPLGFPITKQGFLRPGYVVADPPVLVPREGFLGIDDGFKTYRIRYKANPFEVLELIELEVADRPSGRARGGTDHSSPKDVGQVS